MSPVKHEQNMLQIYRKRSSFNTRKLQELVETRDVIEFKVSCKSKVLKPPSTTYIKYTLIIEISFIL